MDPKVTPIKASTQSFLEIEDIRDDLIILKDGSCALVIQTTATNFGLLSEKEQDAEIYSYGALLNSLNFAIQILIRSKRKDITSYLNLLEEQERKTANQQIKNHITKYREFIQNTVQVNNVLEKHFYIIIPMSFLELGISSTLGSKIKGKTGLPYPKDYIMEKARANLFPKRDHLFRLLNRIGLKSRQLDTQELIKLFFGIYNPDSEGQILSNSEEYQTPIVKPAARFLETKTNKNFSQPETKKQAAIQSPPLPENDKPAALVEENKPVTAEPPETKTTKPAEPEPISEMVNDTINEPEEFGADSPQNQIDQLIQSTEQTTTANFEEKKLLPTTKPNEPAKPDEPIKPTPLNPSTPTAVFESNNNSGNK